MDYTQTYSPFYRFVILLSVLKHFIRRRFFALARKSNPSLGMTGLLAGKLRDKLEASCLRASVVKNLTTSLAHSSH